METALPHHFIELSINSLRQVRNNGFQLNQQPIQQETSQTIPHPTNTQTPTLTTHTKTPRNHSSCRRYINNKNWRNQHRHNYSYTRRNCMETKPQIPLFTPWTTYLSHNRGQ
jgi:hypothetical protein